MARGVAWLSGKRDVLEVLVPYTHAHTHTNARERARASGNRQKGGKSSLTSVVLKSKVYRYVESPHDLRV